MSNKYWMPVFGCLFAPTKCLLLYYVKDLVCYLAGYTTKAILSYRPNS